MFRLVSSDGDEEAGRSTGLGRRGVNIPSLGCHEGHTKMPGRGSGCDGWKWCRLQPRNGDATLLPIVGPVCSTVMSCAQ